MPDFRAFVNQNLNLAGVNGANEAEIVEELALDFEERYERALREGIAPDEAWQEIQARTDWSKIASNIQSALKRDATRLPDPPKRYNPMWNLVGDIRHAARMLRKTPTFTAVAVTTIALCLGANLTIFAVVDSILVRPLPFPGASRLVTTINSYPRSGAPHGSASLPNYYDYREKIKAFASTAIITRLSEHAIVGVPGSPYRVVRDRVSPEFFTTLGVPLLMGRSFRDDEMNYSRSDVAIVTYGFWQNYFNADPQVLGRKFQMDGVPTKVVGVLPRDFRFLSRQTQFYIPAASDPAERAITERHDNRFQLVARLAPTATAATARAQVAALNAEQLKDDPYAADLKAYGFFSIVSGLQEDHVETIKPILLLLQCGVLFLLVMGAVNLINLLLIRASSRAKELAIRQSLGASSGHVISQVMIETLLLALLGGLCGLAVAAGGLRLLEILGVQMLPLGSSIALDGRVALAALVTAIVLGILFALPVAWFNLRGGLRNTLQSESRGGTANRAAQRLRHSFSIAQIALAFVLLSGAGLLGASLKHILETSPGFQTEQAITGQLTLPYKRYPNETASLALLERVVRAMQTKPGVISVSASDMLPFRESDGNGVTAVEGISKENAKVHYRNGVVGDYWQAMGIPLMEGRLLEDADNQRTQRVCVVDRAFAEQYWPDKSALGHRLNDGPVFKENEAFRIVGVVASVKQIELDEKKPLGTVYYPYKYWPSPSVSIIVRTPLAIGALAATVRSTVLDIDPELPIENFARMQDLVDDSLVTRRAPVVLAGVFAGFALLLTAVGTYGVLAYAVTQRRREIGVRMALGAQPRQVLGQFLGLAARLLLSGVFIGVLGAWACGQAMRGLLFGVSPFNIGILAVTGGVTVVVVLCATLLPSRRASLVSPTEALRAE